MRRAEQDCWNRKLKSCCFRYNLDPDGCCNDRELWEALEVAQLKEYVANQLGGLGKFVNTIIYFN